jgi:hypothetical protein
MKMKRIKINAHKKKNPATIPATVMVPSAYRYGSWGLEEKRLDTS